MSTRTDAIKRNAERLAGTSWGLFATITFVILFYVCLRIFIRDIETSMWGYQQFPTNKGSADISLYVALFFPLMQIACGYLAVMMGIDDDKENDKWAVFFGVITLAGFAFDAGLDIYFRTNLAYTPVTLGVAFIETLLIYTLGSEVGLSVSFTVLVIMLPYGFRSLLDFIRRMKTGAPTATPIKNIPKAPPLPKKKKGKKGATPVRLQPNDGGLRQRQEQERLEQMMRDMERGRGL